MRRRTALEGVELVRREKIRTVAELYTCMERVLVLTLLLVVIDW